MDYDKCYGIMAKHTSWNWWTKINYKGIKGQSKCDFKEKYRNGIS